MRPNAERLTRRSPERDKLEVLGRRLKKADDVARLIADGPAAQELRRLIRQVMDDVDSLWLAVQS